MEQHLFSLLFFTGFVPFVLPVAHKYYLIQDERNWTDARTYCQSTHTDLAVISSNDDMVLLQNEADSQEFGSSAWIGMYIDNYGCHWSYGYEPLGSLMFWDDGEPNNNFGDQYCVAITPWGWSDLGCYELYPYICFDETKIGNDSHIYIDNEVDWLEAQAYCRQYHTDLASARDENENTLLQSLISGETWIGLFKDGWKWVDQTNFSYVTWMSGEPDNYMWDENCGYLDMGEAADAQCAEIMPFFCYSATVARKQIVRMKIQSDQDLNDPGVDESILEKIKQKLKEHGMEQNVTVKWSINPDGLVFQKEKN